MNVFSRENGSTLQSSGRGFAIAFVVIVSSLSFTLGYFVGKGGNDNRSGNLLQLSESAEPAAMQENPPAVAKLLSVEEDRSAQSVEKATEEFRNPEKAPSVIISDMQSEIAEDPAPPQQNKKENNLKQVQVKAAEAEKVVSDGSVYTVQIGAFKSSAEAEAFRKKFEKKGFRTFITTAMNRDNEEIYKVKTGQFRDRKGAEILSLKLNKTEQLKTFVTLKQS
jgi:cell division septation protein DedD